VKYWAFISYSHKDTGVADWLHQKLETYRIPKSLVGTPTREGDVPSRIMPIFRDREELPTSSELGDNLQKSLQQSRYLIVICSPAAAQSRWVEEEVRAFKGGSGRDHIVALIAKGAPNATDRGRPEEECFPNSMRFDVDAANKPIPIEPIAADLRSDGDGRERAFLKIVAGLLGVGFDDLYQREKRRQKRRRLVAGAVALLGLLAVAGVYASIARLGHSQKQIQQEVATVKQDAAVATTEFKNVRPKNQEAQDRIKAVADRASQGLDTLEQARKSNAPDAEYTRAYEKAGEAIVDVESEARTTEESIFAKEVAKPLRARMYQEGQLWSKEMQRRQNEKINSMMQNMGKKKP
jgi:hypothetical protein